ncbi:unnamed protein product [Jaminaea pallidilutea]
MAARVSIPTAQHRHQNQGQDSISSSSSLYSSSSTSAIYVPPLSQFDALLQDVTRDWASISEPLVAQNAQLSRLQLSTIAIVRALHGNASGGLHSSAAEPTHRCSSLSDSDDAGNGYNTKKHRIREARRQRRALAHKTAAESRLRALEPSLTALRYEMDYLSAASKAMLRAAELVRQELDFAAAHLYGLRGEGSTGSGSGSIGSSSKSGLCLDLPMTNVGEGSPIDSEPASESESESRSDSGRDAEAYQRPLQDGKSLSRSNSGGEVDWECSSDEESLDLRGESSYHSEPEDDNKLPGSCGSCNDDEDDAEEQGGAGDEWLLPPDEPGLSSLARRTKTRDYFGDWTAAGSHSTGSDSRQQRQSQRGGQHNIPGQAAAQDFTDDIDCSLSQLPHLTYRKRPSSEGPSDDSMGAKRTKQPM